jgi:hypothetical protein
MEALADIKSIPALLIAICLILAVNLVKGIAEFLWKLKEQKDSASEATIRDLTEAVKKNTAATEHLDQRLSELEHVLTSLPKLQEDLRRYYLGLKILAGERWPEIRDEIKQEEIAT